MKKILALALLISTAWAVDSAPKQFMDVCGVNSFDQTSGGALSFIGLAFALVSSIIALAYMYSKFREDPATGVWAKDEAYNLLISVLLFAGLLIFFTGSCSFAQSYSNSDPLRASQQYLDTLAQTNGLNLLRTLTFDSITNQLDATKYLYTGMTPFFGDGVAMRGDRKAHSAQREYLMDLYLPIIASINAQKYILQGIAWMGAYVLLPFAFVMRLVPPTREFGNMLIALFFGLYIVVPFMYAVSGQVFMDNVMNIPSKPVPPDGPYRVDTSLEIFHSYGLDNSQIRTGGVADTMFYKIGSTIPQAIFLPNLVIIVAVSCIMALSKALRAIAV